MVCFWFFLYHTCCRRNSSSSWGESISILSLQVMRLLVQNSGLSHGSKLFSITTELCFRKHFTRLRASRHSACESELIAGLGAVPGANNPSFSALPTTRGSRMCFKLQPHLHTPFSQTRGHSCSAFFPILDSDFVYI